MKLNYVWMCFLAGMMAAFLAINVFHVSLVSSPDLGRVTTDDNNAPTNALLRKTTPLNQAKAPTARAAVPVTKITKDNTPSPPKKKNEKLLTYDRFGGRLNNQLFQFVAALQHAAILNRTLVVPPETNMVEWTGMFDTKLDLWDLSDLNAHYDIDWTTAHATEMPVPTDSKCVVGPGQHRGVLSNAHLYADCPVVHMGGRGGLLFCGQQHRFCHANNHNHHAAQHERVAYDIYQRLNVAKRWRDSILKLPHYELAVHSRTHGDGPYPSGMCVRGSDKTCKPHLDASLHDKYCSDDLMKLDCAKWQNLKAQIHDVNIQKGMEEKKKDYFVLAHDGTHDWTQEFDPQQYRTVSNKPLLDYISKLLEQHGGVSYFHETDRSSPYLLKEMDTPEKFLKQLDRLSQIVLELFSLIEPTFFVGNIYSTLSLAACIMRGEARKDASNMCWMLMHPGETHGTPPPSS